MIRVLHVVTYMGRGGLETMLMNYYRHIDRTRVQFDFLVHREFESEYDREILSMGGKIHHVSRLVPWSRSYREELKAFFRAHPEYRIVHVHQDCLSSVALQCAAECGIPVRIAHSHSAGAVKNLKYPIKRFYMKKIPDYATALLACGKQAGQWMFGGAAFQVVPNAIDLNAYAFDPGLSVRKREALGLTDNLVIGHVGNFTPAKNHGFLLEVFRELSLRREDAVLLLAGDGEGKTAAMEKAKALGICDRVKFLGSRRDVPELMQAMDIFVFPSLYEGLPVTLIEAQAASLPCLISDRVSKESVITEALVTRKSLDDGAKEWVEQVLQMLDKPRMDRCEEIRNAGYDIEAAAARLQGAYIRAWKDQIWNF